MILAGGVWQKPVITEDAYYTLADDCAKRSLALSHVEAVANAIVGTVIGQIVLWLFGLPITEALWLNITFLGVSYIRAFILRRIFARLG